MTMAVVQGTKCVLWCIRKPLMAVLFTASHNVEAMS